jgi:hypothetical protein
MIAEETYQINWIKNISSGIGKRGDPKILEKVIYAFILVEQVCYLLSQNQGDFQ